MSLDVYENRKGNRSARVHLNVDSKIDPFASIVANLYALCAQSFCPWYLCALPIFNACAMQKYIRSEMKESGIYNVCHWTWALDSIM